MHTFEITIQRRANDGWPVVVQYGAPGGFLPVRGEGNLGLDPGDLEQSPPDDYGAQLGRALFRDDVRDAFQQARRQSEDQLHVLLFIESDDLRTLRWERLCGPLDGGWSALALDQRTPFSLYLPSVTDRRFPPISRLDLRALIVAANPDDLERWKLAPFDAAAAVASVRSALGRIPADVLGPVEGAIGPPTLAALCNALTAEHYTLLHVVGHGRFKPADGEPLLFLAKPDGTVDPVPASRLLERLSKLRGARGLPHFAFLSTCEGADPAAEGALGGLAQRLVRELGMPAVLAMTDKVTIESAFALASEFYRRLREHGQVDRALAESYAGIAGRPDIAVPVPALFSRLGGRPLFSLAPDGHLSGGEIAHGLDQLEPLLERCAPTLLAPFVTHAATLRGLLGADPAQLARDRQEEWDAALAGVDELCLEATDLGFEALANDQEPPAYDGRCPFKGLESFKPGDRPFFFGRDEWVRRLRAERLERHPFLAVLGPSGSGKSSVVRAGLVPALQDRETGLEAIVLTPGADPLATLEARLADLGDRAAVIVVDQFEESFTLCTDPEARQAFFDRLLALAESRRVIVTMRADFWGDCASYPALRERMLAHQELVPPLTLEELRAAMEAQAQAVGLRFETGLVGTILADVAGEPGAMPLLQHALLELWNRRHGRRLKAEEYQAIGRVQGAIARTAEAAYEELSRAGTGDQLREIFLRLTRLDDAAAPGELRRDTRRRVRLEDLVPLGGELAQTKALVNRLADRRLVVTTALGEDRLTEVEVAHEALIRRWPRLTAWLDENRAILRLRQGITEAADEWIKAGRPQDFLVHKGPRLNEAERLRGDARFGLNATERAYLDACVASREEERAERDRQRRRRVQFLGAGLGLALLFGIFAAWQWWRAAEQRRQAERVTADLAVTHGLDLCRSYKNDDGLLWLARGLELADRLGDRGRELATRTHLAAWRSSFPQLTHLLEHQAPVVNAAVDGKGQMIVTASLDSTARRWNAQTGQPLGGPLGHDGPVVGVVIDPAGAMIVTASHDGKARRWDARTGQLIPPLLPHGGPVTGVLMSDDGALILTITGGTTIQIWKADSGEPIGKPLPVQKSFQHVRFDARTVHTLTSFDRGQYWDVPTGGELQKPRAISQDFARDVRGNWSKYQIDVPNSQITLRWGWGNSLLMYRNPSGADDRPVLSIENRIDSGDSDLRVEAVAFSPDGEEFVAAGGPGAALRDAEDGTIKKSLPHGGAVRAVAFSRDGKRVLTGGWDQKAWLWDVAKRERIGGPFLHGGHINAVALTLDGGTVLTGGADGNVRIWDVRSGRSPGPLSHPGPVLALAIEPTSGKTVVTGCDDLKARLWDLATGRLVRVLPHGDWVKAVAFSPDGKTIVTGCANGLAQRWDVATGGSVGRPLHHKGRVDSVTFNPSGTLIGTASLSGAPSSRATERNVQIWDSATDNDIWSFSEPASAAVAHSDFESTVAFRPDHQAILIGDMKGTISLWRIPVPLEAQTERIILWTRVATGKELGDEGAIHLLDDRTWHQYNQRLNELGGPPPSSRASATPGRPEVER